MDGIWTMGEMLVEIMRQRVGSTFEQPDVFLGPFPSGAPAIFIDTVARLGKPAGIIGTIGDDDFGNSIINRLKMDGVDCSKVQVDTQTTGVAFVRYNHDGSRNYIFHFSNSAAVLTKFKSEEDYFQPKFFHIMGCSLSADPTFAIEILKAAKYFIENGAMISFDPNIRIELLRTFPTFRQLTDEVIDLTSYFFPGIAELTLLTNTHSVEEAVHTLLKKPRMKAIIVKQGSDGCTVYTKEQTINVPAFEVEEIDPTGAGDCFDAAFLVGVLEGKQLQEAALMANAAGALNAKAFGPMEGDISMRTIGNLISTSSYYNKGMKDDNQR